MKQKVKKKSKIPVKDLVLISDSTQRYDFFGGVGSRGEFKSRFAPPPPPPPKKKLTSILTSGALVHTTTSTVKP